ncbi:shikimate kinase [Pararcticibacter amylolyticus]|uniref:Shikimate kinase n=1 Tax=Pararcticibacter amylolyticus TaxID=2173175 RepID=A0A2U2PAI0_9SPHI|nr:shikimate kinase [Pararcticibacter amylolyticus]PWG78406.1 shikimate kinase [Pararcticibacter amylolyticus]
MRIFLIGFMGCGKTTWGKKLASALEIPFLDLDALIREHTGMTVPQYFQEFGEARFRETERDVLQSAAFPEDAVISTGGGAPCYFDNMDWMNSHGIAVYMSLSPGMLASRLENAKEVRPVLEGRKGEALVQFIQEKLQEREPFYSKANVIVTGPEFSVEKFISAIEDYQRK